MDKEPLFSVSLSDCEMQTFTVSGAGGQHRDRARTGVRVIHHPSGARGEARDAREQHRNKRQAFIRMTETPAFKFWVTEERKRREGIETLEAKIRRELEDPDITQVEVRRDGEWALAGSAK